MNGRSAPDAETLEAISGLNADGMRVEVVTGDIAAPETAQRLVGVVEDAGFRVRGVLNSATVLDDQIVLNMSESAAARVFRSKVAGSWRLHAATGTSGSWTGGWYSLRPLHFSARRAKEHMRPPIPGSTDWLPIAARGVCRRWGSTGARGQPWGVASRSPTSGSR